MSIIICKIPKAGLGNQLFPLMKSIVLKQITGLPLIITKYRQFSIGPYLRREKSKRRYAGYFKFQKSIFLAWLDEMSLFFYTGYKSVQEPSLQKDQLDKGGKLKYIYSAIPHWKDYFEGLKDHRDKVIQSFFEMLTPDILQYVQSKPKPCIGVHIRMGDFRKLQAGENFAAVGAVRTPEDYFVDIIKNIREIAGENLPVTIFTDGYRHEFTQLFDLPAVSIAENNPDIADMVLLSKSKIIVTSAGSTFSYWSGFLSEAVLIMHPDHLHASIRPGYMMDKLYEGPFDKNNALLLKNIKTIHE